MAMRAGAFNTRITLRRPGPSQKDAMGATVPQWIIMATRIAADREPLSDGERSRAAQTVGQISDRWRIRRGEAWAGVNPDWQLVDDAGQAHEIVHAKPIGRRLRDGFELTTRAAAVPPIAP